MRQVPSDVLRGLDGMAQFMISTFTDPDYRDTALEELAATVSTEDFDAAIKWCSRPGCE